MKKHTKADIAYLGLKSSIINCDLAPASKIKISDVCQTYEVSLGAAREALSRLAAEGMVTMETQKGSIVSPVSWEEFQQLMEARIEIEVFCLTHSIEAGDMDWEVEVAAAHHRLARLSEERDRSLSAPEPDWLDAHAAFHRALVAACPNKCMLEMREMLYARSERYRHWAVSLCLALGQRDDVQEHAEISRLTLARDSKGACAAMRPHFERTKQDLLDAAIKGPVDGDGGGDEKGWRAAIRA